MEKNTLFFKVWFVSYSLFHFSEKDFLELKKYDIDILGKLSPGGQVCVLLRTLEHMARYLAPVNGYRVCVHRCVE